MTRKEEIEALTRAEFAAGLLVFVIWLAVVALVWFFVRVLRKGPYPAWAAILITLALFVWTMVIWIFGLKQDRGPTGLLYLVVYFIFGKCLTIPIRLKKQ